MPRRETEQLRRRLRERLIERWRTTCVLCGRTLDAQGAMYCLEEPEMDAPHCEACAEGRAGRWELAIDVWLW